MGLPKTRKKRNRNRNKRDFFPHALLAQFRNSIINSYVDPVDKAIVLVIGQAFFHGRVVFAETLSMAAGTSTLITGKSAVTDSSLALVPMTFKSGRERKTSGTECAWS